MFYSIRLKKIVPKTPQQNSVIERMNRTIKKRIRCMLSHAELLKLFWREAIRTTVDLTNLSPLVPLKGDVLERVLKYVSYDYLRVFECKVFDIHFS